MMSEDDIVEIVTNNCTYIGKFIRYSEDKVYFKDLLVVAIGPPVDDGNGGRVQSPQLEPRNLFSLGSDWCIPANDIYYFDKVLGNKFKDMYLNTVQHFNTLKDNNK